MTECCEESGLAGMGVQGTYRAGLNGNALAGLVGIAGYRRGLEGAG